MSTIGCKVVSLQLQHTTSTEKKFHVQPAGYADIQLQSPRLLLKTKAVQSFMTYDTTNQQHSITLQKTWIVWNTAVRASNLTYTTHWTEYFLLMSNLCTNILVHKPWKGSVLKHQLLPSEAQIIYDNIHSTPITTLHNKTLPLARQTSLNFNNFTPIDIAAMPKPVGNLNA